MGGEGCAWVVLVETHFIGGMIKKEVWLVIDYLKEVGLVVAGW